MLSYYHTNLPLLFTVNLWKKIESDKFLFFFGHILQTYLFVGQLAPAVDDIGDGVGR